MYDTALSEQDTPTLIKLGQLIDNLIRCCNTDLNFKMFNESLWRFVFGALEYMPNNFCAETKVKKHSYVEFIEKDTRMKVVSRAATSDEFEDLVKLRFRVLFYIEFVFSDQTPEEMMSHFQKVRDVFDDRNTDVETQK